jgi:hypothetical protein
MNTLSLYFAQRSLDDWKSVKTLLEYPGGKMAVYTEDDAKTIIEAWKEHFYSFEVYGQSKYRIIKVDLPFEVIDATQKG